MVGCLIFTLLVVSLGAAAPESNAEVRAAFSVFKTEYAKAYGDEAAELHGTIRHFFWELPDDQRC
jgi:hypothetical protein